MSESGSKPQGDFIGGRFALPDEPAGELRFEDPGDLDAAGPVFPFAPASVDRAIESARAAYPAWRDTSVEARAACLRKLGDAIEDSAELLAHTIAREVGKPLWEARTEVAAMRGKIEITLGAGLEQVREQSFELGPGRTGRWRAHARGVLGVLGPFNFPGHLVHGHVVPALATGNTVVVKPSERTPASGELYAELVARAGFPPGVFSLIQGDGAQGAALAAHPDLAGVLFTGSYAVGRRILEATLDQPWKIVALEMGGKNAVLVLDDADVDAAVVASVFGACVTTGQRCSGTSRVIVDRAVGSEFQEKLVRTLGALRIGYALDEAVFMGPLISNDARERHAGLLRLARDEGAEVLVAGGPCDGPRRGHYVRPSAHRIARTLCESRYQQQEHFVPDLAVLEVDSLEDGLAAFNASDYGLAGSVFTAARERFERVYRESRLALLNWNTSTVGASSALPFGGVGRSGNDRPAAVLSTLYCTYPVASVELPEASETPSWPGFPNS